MSTKGMALVGAGIVGAVLVGLCGRWYAMARGITRAFGSSACVAPFADATTGKSRTWDSRIRLQDGTQIRIEAACRGGGQVRITYASDPAPRVVTPRIDYIYPCDIRIDYMNGRLYVKNTGLGGGLVPETIVYEYDLAARAIKRRIHVREAWLPDECPIG